MKRLTQSLQLFLLFNLFFIVTQQAQSSDSSSGSGTKRFNITDLNKHAEQRSLKRFTLKEWMEGKEKRKMMDMWLSLNTPSPYEFYLSGTLNQFSTETKTASTNTQTSNKSYEGVIAAYATCVGLTAEYQNNTEENFNDATAMFNLRIFGDTLQGTHFTLHYGLRTRIENGGLYRLNQQFSAATLQLYATKFFGFQGQYRYYPSINESYYGDTQTTESTVGAFIDFDAFRIFGDFVQEKQNSNLNLVDKSINRTGTKVGLRIYF